MTGPSTVILNDTATRYHHGCARVMRLLTEGVTRAGCTVTFCIPARADWARDPAMLAAIGQADLIVINGEGTLHDGAAQGARLLSVLDHPARRRVPVALVNALWQDNPADWSRWLPDLALIAARDSRSAASLSLAGAKDVRWLPDLSLSGDQPAANEPRQGLIIGDSVRWSARRALGHAAQRRRAHSLPTKTLGSPVWAYRPLNAALWRLYHLTPFGPRPPFALARNEGEYLRLLSRASGHITGRFHGVCLSMVTQTPFLALASTTSKVEMLLADAGLGKSRLLTPEVLAQDPEVPPFDTTERDAIRAFRARANSDAATLFRDLAALA